MTLLKPFKALRYKSGFGTDISKVICPPYDVISPAQLKSLKKSSKYNFVHLLLASKKDYKAIGKKFRKFLTDKIFSQDGSDSIYLYEQQFKYEGKKYSRFGVLSLLRMDKRGGVCPHEYTLAAPKEDRRRIIQECKANLSPIFVLIPERLKSFEKLYEAYKKKKPLVVFKEGADIRSRIWRVDDPKVVKTFCRQTGEHNTFIADGHHRFEVSYNYYLKNKGKFKDLNYIMAYITDLQPGLLMLATHRIVDVADVNIDLLKKYFKMQAVSQKIMERRLAMPKGKVKNAPFCFGIYRKGKFYFLTLRNKNSLPEEIKDGYERLDTYILHKFVFPLLNIDGKITYTHSLKEAKMQTTKAKTAFLLRPTPIDVVVDMASLGIRLPQKSTYFYPKVSSGVVVRRF